MFSGLYVLKLGMMGRAGLFSFDCIIQKVLLIRAELRIPQEVVFGALFVICVLSHSSEKTTG